MNAPVFQLVVSPPRPACLTTNEDTFCADPRSTWQELRRRGGANLLLPARLPSTALAAPSAELHGAEPVAVWPWARFVPSSGAAAGGVNPSLNDGGTSAAPVPHALADEPIV